MKSTIHFGEAKHRFGAERDSDVDDTLDLESGADAADARNAAISNGIGKLQINLGQLYTLS